MENKNRFDEMLKRSLDGAPSRLPNDMLDRILAEKRKTKRAMFFWLNFSIAVYFGVMAAVLGLNKEAFSSLSAYGGNTVKERYQNQKTLNPGKEHSEESSASDHSNNNGDEAMEAGKVAVNGVTNSALQPVYRHPSNAENANATRRPPAWIEDQITTDFEEDILEANSAQGDINVPPAKYDEPVDKNKADQKYAIETGDIPVSPTEEMTTADGPIGKPSSDSISTSQNETNPNGTGKTKDRNFDLDMWKPKFNLTFSAGGLRQNPRLNVPETDPRYTHRDYAGLLQSSIQAISGLQFAFGTQLTFNDKFYAQSCVQYFSATQRFHFDYLVHDVPVIDTNGEIKGYVELQDTFHQRFIIDREVKSQLISIPIQFGYIQKFGKGLEFQLGVGFTPQFQMTDAWVLPQKLNLLDMRNMRIGNLFSMPTSFSLGLLKETKHFSLGLTASAAPFETRGKKLDEAVFFSSKRYDFGMLIRVPLFRQTKL